MAVYRTGGQSSCISIDCLPIRPLAGDEPASSSKLIHGGRLADAGSRCHEASEPVSMVPSDDGRSGSP